ncbi:hypothetical protein CWE12_02670 [Aliidiomarina sedimenti]|uniref:Uncharacterized protein n=1 Tax=Aliidiomarina sedimenti TaxID=1933879 RepID=A0ABY0C262_9GAMM|nr:hypothetical protein [Aliidiomarina sedimenti]RUO31919.1 hypothetical protein CWE12_02670 [Aliidiomarina sedimenti]
MNKILLIVTLFALLFPAISQAQSKCPLPEGMRASVDMVKEIIEARHNGQTKEELETHVPLVAAQIPWAGVIMQSIVDEIYSTPEPLNVDVHAMYRMEVCFILDQHPETSPIFEQAYPQLKECESLDSTTDKKPLIMCSMDVAQEVSGVGA